jgi:hypothetical protein
VARLQLHAESAEVGILFSHITLARIDREKALPELIWRKGNRCLPRDYAGQPDR